MKQFLKNFLAFVIFGFFMILSVIMAAVLGYYIASFLSLDLDGWGKIIFFTIWLCFTMPAAAAILEEIGNHFF